MEKLTEKYRLSIYQEIIEISSHKIYIVKSSLDDKIYIKKVLEIENYEIYKEIKRLDIPNIPKVYEIIQIDDKAIIIEEYINGHSLKEILDRSQTLPEAKVIEHILDLIDILDRLYSGSSHIIHRDIKPSNIMINNDGILKLIDFDISRIYKSDKSTDTNILGTYGYAAPEQFGFYQSDSRTDIYSIGATMNILLTGKLPMEDLYSGKLSKIISKCIELDPKKRFQNIDQLKDELLKIYRRHNKKSKKNDKSKLPGFNSDKVFLKVIASLWYGILIMTSLGFFEGKPISEDQVLNIIIPLFLFCLTLLYGNYKDIRCKLPIINSKNPLIRLFGYLLYTMILFLIVGIIIPN